MNKLVNKFKKKVVVLASVMLVLQPVFGLAVLPAKTFAANYELAAATKKAGLDTTTGVFGNLKTDNDTGMHVNPGEQLYVDTFAPGSGAIDDNGIVGATLNIKYKTEADYNGTGVLKYALDGQPLTDTIVVPSNNSGYVTQSFNLYATGITTKAALENLDVSLVNNAVVEGETVEDIVIDYLWIDAVTNKTPQVSLTSKPAVLTNATTAHFAWTGQDDVTDPASLEYSYRLDGGVWSAWVSDSGNTVDFIGLTGSAHIFDLRVQDGNVVPNQNSTSYVWTVDTVVPTFTSEVTPEVAGPGIKTVDIEVVPSEALAEQSVPAGVLNQRVIALGATYGVKLTINEVEGDPLTVYVCKNVEGKYVYTYNLETAGKKTVGFDVEGSDLAGNAGTGKGSFEMNNLVLSPAVETPVVTPAVATVVVTEPTVQNDQYGWDGSSQAGETQGEVKADTTQDENKDENKDEQEDVKGKKNVPLWGIIFLLILAGIGGYLFYSQNPEKPNGKK